jgi:hypothetical protein
VCSAKSKYLLISSIFVLMLQKLTYICHILMQTLIFVWLALSGWLFRVFIFSTFVLPFAAPLLLRTFANRAAIEVNHHRPKLSNVVLSLLQLLQRKSVAICV